jgi:hypothetical protein
MDNENSFCWINIHIEQKGKPRKWVTLYALKALKNAGLDI